MGNFLLSPVHRYLLFTETEKRRAFIVKLEADVPSCIPPSNLTSLGLNLLRRSIIGFASAPVRPSVPAGTINEHGEQLLQSSVLQAKHRDPVLGRRLSHGGISAPPGPCERRSPCPQEVPRQVTDRRRRPASLTLLLKMSVTEDVIDTNRPQVGFVCGSV